MKVCDILVVGAGPAGMAAALAAREAGAGRILLVDRDREPGGILNQCIHTGFGLEWFREEMTGPEFSERLAREVAASGIECLTETMVLSVDRSRTATVLSPESGFETIMAKAVVLAMGCRERPRGAVAIPGDRPAGVFTAGTAQRMVNLENWRVGGTALILGTGDIGLIMARRLHLEGVRVLGVMARGGHAAGLRRNVQQCLYDFDIPLMLHTTVTVIHGKQRLEGVTLSETGLDKRPLPGTGRFVPCDTLLLSVGLIPENELSRQAGLLMDPATGGPVVDETCRCREEGFFACGNVLQVHDLADWVVMESRRAGRSAAAFCLGNQPPAPRFRVEAGPGIRQAVPQRIAGKRAELFFRSAEPFEKSVLEVSINEKMVIREKRTFVFPGEMQRLILTPEILQEKQSGIVTLTLRKEA